MKIIFDKEAVDTCTNLIGDEARGIATDMEKINNIVAGIADIWKDSTYKEYKSTMDQFYSDMSVFLQDITNFKDQAGVYAKKTQELFDGYANMDIPLN